MIGMSIVKRKQLPGWVILVVPIAAVFVTLDRKSVE